MNQIDKIESIIKRADLVPTTKEVLDIFNVLLQAVTQLKEQTFELIEEKHEETKSGYQELYVEIEEVEKNIEKMYSNIESLHQKSINQVLNKVENANNQIEIVRAMFNPILNKISEIENKEIPQIPEDLVNEKRLLEEIEALEKKLNEKITQLPAKSVGGASRRVFIPYRDDLTSACDGVTKVFYLSKTPLKTGTIMVYGTDFPVILRPDVDFTVVNKTLTLTSQVPAPSLGATLIVTYFA